MDQRRKADHTKINGYVTRQRKGGGRADRSPNARVGMLVNQGDNADELTTDRKTGRMESTSRSAKLIGCFLGIFFSYFIYGLLQETITKNEFGGERFTFFTFLVFFQCIVNMMVAGTACLLKGIPVSIRPLSTFAQLSFTYVGAMVASNKALAYVSYPTQVLGKSAKPIPVLVLGVLIGKKSYSAAKYLSVLLIVIGVALFMYKDSTSTVEDGGFGKLFGLLGLGECLLGLSLLLDGLTGVLQEKLRKDHEVQAFHMMFAVNAVAPLYLAIGLAITGEGERAVYFLIRHPEVLLNIVSFSLASAVGQIFIFFTITLFGPLTCSIFTTTRKFFTILASVVVFGNVLLSRQWTGVGLVFLGLAIDSYIGKSRSTSSKSPGPQNTV